MYLLVKKVFNPLTANDKLSRHEDLTFLWTWILRWDTRSFATIASLCNTLSSNKLCQKTVKILVVKGYFCLKTELIIFFLLYHNFFFYEKSIYDRILDHKIYHLERMVYLILLQKIYDSNPIKNFTFDISYYWAFLWFKIFVLKKASIKSCKLIFNSIFHPFFPLFFWVFL